MPRTATTAVLALAACAAAIWLPFQLGGLDSAISRAFFDPASGRFPLRDNWWLAAAGHTGLKYLAVGFWCALAAAAIWLPQRHRDWQPILREAAAGMLLAALTVLWLRGLSTQSCPWDLAAFGGPPGQGPGRCLPSAHASSGFALFGLYFALRARRPRAARAALAAAWLVGTVAGAVQVARGAHFASHALWTAWVAWAVTYALHLGVRRLRPASRSGAAPSGAASPLLHRTIALGERLGYDALPPQEKEPQEDEEAAWQSRYP